MGGKLATNGKSRDGISNIFNKNLKKYCSFVYNNRKITNIMVHTIDRLMKSQNTIENNSYLIKILTAGSK